MIFFFFNYSDWSISQAGKWLSTGGPLHLLAGYEVVQFLPLWNSFQLIILKKHETAERAKKGEMWHLILRVGICLPGSSGHVWLTRSREWRKASVVVWEGAHRSHWPFTMCLLRAKNGPSSVAIPAHLLEKAMAPHCSTLAWKTPRTEEPGGLQSMGSQRVGHNWATRHSVF